MRARSSALLLCVEISAFWKDKDFPERASFFVLLGACRHRDCVSSRRRRDFFRLPRRGIFCEDFSRAGDQSCGGGTGVKCEILHARLHDEYSLCVSKENSLLYITYMGWLQFFKLVVGICTVQMYVDGQPAGRHNPVICACAKDGTCGMSACKQHFRSPHLPEGLCKRRLARPLITHCLHLAGRDSSVA